MNGRISLAKLDVQLRKLALQPADGCYSMCTGLILGAEMTD